MSETPEKQVLKPCPFCGGEAVLCRALWGDFIKCPDCEATTKSSNDFDKAVGFWNRRAGEGGGQ